MFREDPASRLMLLSPLGIPQGAGVLEIDITQHPGHSGAGTLFTDNLYILRPPYLMLSRKSRLRFLAGGKVRETCCEERLRRLTRTASTTWSLMVSFC